MPLSTISEWFKNEEWSTKLAKRLGAAMQEKHTARIRALNATRGLRLKQRYEDARAEARAELERYQYNPLFIAGIMLYWGEGDKSKNMSGVKLTNSDPALIGLYTTFLTEALGVPLEKIRGHVVYYPDLDEASCRRFWAAAAKLPLDSFTKSTLIQGRHETRRRSWGICTITVSSAYLKEKMREWMRLLPERLKDKGYYENI